MSWISPNFYSQYPSKEELHSLLFCVKIYEILILHFCLHFHVPRLRACVFSRESFDLFYSHFCFHAFSQPRQIYFVMYPPENFNTWYLSSPLISISLLCILANGRYGSVIGERENYKTCKTLNLVTKVKLETGKKASVSSEPIEKNIN